MEKSDWSASTGAKEFIPKDKFVKTAQEFPDFDALDDDKPKKKKKGQQAPVQQKAAEEQVVDESTPYKGKPSSFFVMQQDLNAVTPTNQNGYILNDDQWNFIFLYYPEYSADPSAMMVYLYQEAYNKEQAEKVVAEQYKPTKKGGKIAGDEDESSEDEAAKKSKKLRQVGNNNKQKNKKD